MHSPGVAGDCVNAPDCVNPAPVATKFPPIDNACKSRALSSTIVTLPNVPADAKLTVLSNVFVAVSKMIFAVSAAVSTPLSTLLGCAGAPTEPGTSTLRVGTSGDYTPFSIAGPDVMK